MRIVALRLDVVGEIVVPIWRGPGPYPLSTPAKTTGEFRLRYRGAAPRPPTRAEIAARVARTRRKP